MTFQQTYSLLIVQLITKRFQNRLLLLFVFLLGLSVQNLFMPVFEGRLGWFGIAVSVSFVLFVYTALLKRRGEIRLSSEHIQLSAPFWSFNIPYSMVSGIKTTMLSQLFRQRELTDREFDLLGMIYQNQGVYVGLKEMPAWWRFRRMLFSHYLFTPDGKGVLLIVEDWRGLGQVLNRELVSRGEAKIMVESALSSDPVLNGQVAVLKEGEECGEMPAFFPQPNEPHFAYESRSKPLILVVEDNQHIRTQLENLLCQQYEVALAEDGATGLRLALAMQPDLILSDLEMPRMNGHELLSAVRNNSTLHRTPFIFLTATSALSNRIQNLQSGADDYLVKPCNDLELIARVRNLLRHRAQERELEHLNEKLEAKIQTQIAELVVSGDLQRFMPQAVVENIKQGRIVSTDVFERRQITVLFVDIVGFTPLTDRLEPNKLAMLLNEYLREMTALAIFNGGTVDKFIGDALMVLFGAPETQSPIEQAQSAIHTAFAMLHQSRELSERWRQTLAHDFRVRVGINTGECTIGVFGSDLQKSYTAIGSHVNIASRLEGEAMPQGILVSRATYELTKGLIKGEPRGRIKLKGVLDPVEAWDVVALKT